MKRLRPYILEEEESAMLMINHMSAGYGDSNVIKDLNLEVADRKIWNWD